MLNWLDRKKSDDLPNIQGRSAESLIELYPEAESDSAEWTAKYRYVAGLRRNDPGDLVLMYMKKPSRWKHHAAGPPSIFRERKWVIVPLDFVEQPFITHISTRKISDGGELNENVSLAEFKRRLNKTLDFLRENNRPNWQTVVAENEAFLKSLETE